MSKRGFANETWSPASYEWYTPRWVFSRLGLVFDLDVASPGADIVPWVPALEHLTIRDDALSVPWHGRVWCNPPYGNLVPKFIGRLSDHGDGIALVLSRTETVWLQDAAERADAICFARGRIDHVPGEGVTPSRPQVGSVFLAFGEVCADALERAAFGFTARPFAPEIAQTRLL